MFKAGRHEDAETVKDHQKGHSGGSVLTVRKRCHKAEIRKENRNCVKGNAAVL